MLPDPAIRLTEQQHGIVARCQLLDHVDQDRLETLVALRYLERVQHGVYRVVGSPATGHQLAIAAALRARPAVITGPYVLAHLGIDTFEHDAPFEILTRPGRSLQNVTFPHRPDPDPDRPTIRWGRLHLTSPVDALIDTGRFAGELEARQLRLAYDQLRWRGQMTTDRFDRRLEELLAAGDAGALALDAVLGLADRRAEADGERLLGELLCGFHPAPEPQVWVTPRHRPDWYFRELRLSFEYAGSVDHAHVEALRADAARDRELTAEGIRTEHVRAADLSPVSDLLARCAAVITLRARELGVTAPVYRG